MKVFNIENGKKKVYVQLNDVMMLMQFDGVIPAEVMEKHFMNMFIVTDENRFEFSEFTEPSTVEFFEKCEWIPDYKQYRGLSEEKIIECGQQIGAQMNEVAVRWNGMTPEQREDNQDVALEHEKLEFKMHSLAEILWTKQGHRNMPFPIVPDCSGFVVDNEDWGYDLYIQSNEQLYGNPDMSNWFSDFYNLETINNLDLLDTSKVTNMKDMFASCASLTTIPQLDTSNVTDLSRMFYYCSKLQSIPLLDTSNATKFSEMFSYCSKLQSIPQLNTSNATNMMSMFGSCTSLKSIPLLDCGKVTSMATLFGYSNVNSLTDLGGFKNLKISITAYFLDKAPNLTVESLMNVINNIYDLTGNGLSGQSLKFGQTNLDKLTAEQIAVATAKGWTLTA